MDYQKRTTRALERIADALEKLAERRDADDNVILEDRCKRCGLYEWDCECDDDSLPEVSTLRGGAVFTDPSVVDTPWWAQMMSGEKRADPADHFPWITLPQGGAFIQRVDEPLLVKPSTPGAPPPELPDELHSLRLDPPPNPVIKVGDKIRVDGHELEVTDVGLGHIEVKDPEAIPEGAPGTWSFCGNTRPHGAHVYDTGSNEGPYYNVQCLGTPMPNPRGGDVHAQEVHTLSCEFHEDCAHPGETITVETRRDVDMEELRAAGWSGCMHDSDCACSPKVQARDTAIITATYGIGKPRSSGGPYNDHGIPM